MKPNAEFNTIAELDLAPIKAKLMQQESGEGWSLEHANAVEMEYRRFLYLMKLFPNEQVAPLIDVDVFWHYHILDTMKYAADCEFIFGYFLHHCPNSELQGEHGDAHRDRTGARMQELYEATFGEGYMRQAQSAWCNPTTRNSVQSQPALVITAWCNPTISDTTRSQSAPAKIAWCNPTTSNSGRAQLAPAKTAWCNPTTPSEALSRMASAITAWCNPTTPNKAWLEGATAIKSRSHNAAQNNGSYTHIALAAA